MSRRLVAASAVALSLIATAACAQKDEITLVESDDAAMNAAIAEARATLPVFWRVADSGAADVERTIVKVALPVEGGGREHLWMALDSHSNVAVRGRLESRPEYIDGLHQGDPVTVEPSQISDWAYVRNGKMYGAYTLRVVLDRLTPETRKEQEEALAPTPLEPQSK